MKYEKIRWRLSPRDVEHLSLSLKPIRTRRQVAAILSCSLSHVCQLESSALRKVVRALKTLEASGQLKLKPQENNENNPNHE